jgi:octaprenyl-diphosphate synthase
VIFHAAVSRDAKILRSGARPTEKSTTPTAPYKEAHTMTQVRPSDAGVRRTLSRLLGPIAAELAEVELRLQAELRHPDPAIDELARHSFRIGGKRLRPALLLLSARLAGDVNDDHRTLAAVVEMVHTATLVHDDVLDEAVVRRHCETMNARWDNHSSILLGDFLFTRAFALASSLDDVFACRALSNATNKVCEGELRQTAASGEFWLSRSDYLEIVQAKTAELCACCCELGVRYAGGSPADGKRLAAFGRDLGIAFQIADDLLDLEGDEAVTGKSLGTDLAHRKMTLPLILLRDGVSQADASRLQAIFDQADAAHTGLLVDWLEDSGAMRQARHTAEDYARQAAAALAPLPDSSAKDTLLEIARFAVSRQA